MTDREQWLMRHEQIEAQQRADVRDLWVSIGCGAAIALIAILIVSLCLPR